MGFDPFYEVNQIETIRGLIKKHGIRIESGRYFGVHYHEAKGNLHKFVYDLLGVLEDSEFTTNSEEEE